MAAYRGPISAGPARSPSVSRMRAVNGRPGVAVPGDSDGCGRYPGVVSTESIGRLRARVGTVPRPRSVTIWCLRADPDGRRRAAPLGPPTSCRPAIPPARSGGWVPCHDRIRIAAGRLARRARLERHFGPPPGSSARRRQSARRPDSSMIPRAFVRCSMSWTSWPRIPVQPGRSRTDRQTCGGCGPAADLPADTDPWHQCRAGISDQSFPRTTGTPSSLR
jgi:hypothetical protein